MAIVAGAHALPSRDGRAGAPAVTHTPGGRLLPADDVHRIPGRPLARPILAGPLHDKEAPALLYLHAGGWVLTGAGALQTTRATIRRWADRHVGVWAADYRRDAQSLPDAINAYGSMRRRVGDRRPICLLGESAGGTLALLLAARFPNIRCVITYAAVGDMRLVRTGPLEAEVRDWLLPFGGLARWNPLTNARRIRQPVLLVYHVLDTVVSPRNSLVLSSRLACSRRIALPNRRRGVKTIHGQITSVRADLEAFRAALNLVRTQETSTGSRSSGRCTLR